MPRRELSPTIPLVDVDGTLSNTAVHMPGYNARLAEAFPEIPDGLLEDLGAARVAYREANPSLTHAQQSEQWEQRHPGLKFDSQTSFYEGTVPDVFTPELMRRIRTWGEDPANFGHGEYDDVESFIASIRKMGFYPVLFTLGSRERTTGEAGWQERKILSAPNMRDLARHVAEELPEGGKGAVIDTWYDRDTGTFHIPRTDGGETIEARGAVLVDDVAHNVEHLPGQAMGVLLDRKGKYEGRSLPANVHVVRSLAEVPAMVQEYDSMRQHAR